jgi:hypothetical protein
MPKIILNLNISESEHKILLSITEQTGLMLEQIIEKLISNHLLNNQQWTTITLPMDVVRDLVTDYGNKWEGTNKYDAFNEVLKEALEKEF